MDEIVILILKQYGLPGIILLSSIWIVKVLLKHFMEKDNRKDEQILQMSLRFSEALDHNTSALQELKETQISLINSNGKISDGFERFEDQNTNDHGKILNMLGKSLRECKN